LRTEEESITLLQESAQALFREKKNMDSMTTK